MVDSAACSATRLQEEPCVTWRALRSLKALLAEGVCTLPEKAVEHRHLSSAKGDADAQETPMEGGGAAEAVRSAKDPSEVAPAPSRSEGRGDSAADAGASRSSRPVHEAWEEGRDS